VITEYSSKYSNTFFLSIRFNSDLMHFYLRQPTFAKQIIQYNLTHVTEFVKHIEFQSLCSKISNHIRDTKTFEMFGNNLMTPEKFTIFINICEVPKY
jgi:hypothetical protein